MPKSITIAPSLHLSASLNLPTEINGPFSDIKVYERYVFSILNVLLETKSIFAVTVYMLMSRLIIETKPLKGKQVILLFCALLRSICKCVLV